MLAVKELPRPGGRDNMADLMREVETMRNLKHKHIVRYLGTSITKESLYVLLEYVPGVCVFVAVSLRASVLLSVC
jgi:serine/threonine protein kinase